MRDRSRPECAPRSIRRLRGAVFTALSLLAFVRPGAAAIVDPGLAASAPRALDGRRLAIVMLLPLAPESSPAPTWLGSDGPGFERAAAATVRSPRRANVVEAAVSSGAQPVLSEDAWVRRRATIRALQDRVLARSGPAPGLAHRFENFPALAVWVNDAEIAALAADPEVACLGPDAKIVPDLARTVPFIGGDRVHAAGITGRGATVAILDSGIDTSHVDLKDHLAIGDQHFLGQGSDIGNGAVDHDNHGTNVGGVVGARGRKAGPGVAPDALLLPIQVWAAWSSWLSDLLMGIDYAVAIRLLNPNLAAINISLHMTNAFTQCPCDRVNADTKALQGSIGAAQAAGIPTFVASSNLGLQDQSPAPACLSSAYAVAGVYGPGQGLHLPDQIDEESCEGNCTHLAAPSVNVITTDLPNTTAMCTGTSIASPFCAGVAALVASARAAGGLPQLSPDSLFHLLRDTGHPVDYSYLPPPGLMRVDARLAVDRGVPPYGHFLSPAPGDTLRIGAADTLRWNMTDPMGLTSLKVEMSRDGAGGPYETMLDVTEPDTMLAWTVTGPVSNQVFFRVSAVDSAGNSAVDVMGAPAVVDSVHLPPPPPPKPPVYPWALGPISPNPARQRVTIAYSVAKPTHVEVWIRDLAGRTVATFRPGWRGSGNGAIDWHPDRPGVYFASLVTPERTITKRFVAR